MTAREVENGAFPREVPLMKVLKWSTIVGIDSLISNTLLSFFVDLPVKKGLSLITFYDFRP